MAGKDRKSKAFVCRSGNFSINAAQNCGAELRCRIAAQKCGTEFQRRNTTQNFSAELQSKIVVQNCGAELCEITKTK